MCAILGIINKDQKEPISNERLRYLSDLMSHRGPDSSGTYLNSKCNIGLAHRRLSLVDFSSKGDQPMEKDNVALVFNGEVYNFREIRSELEKFGHKFKSGTDTEVIISAYKEWGIDCLNKFNGAFAFILLDNDTNEVFIVRDRLGEKPLYYIFQDDKFIFSSEVKPILKQLDKVEPDLERIKTDLIFNFWSEKSTSYFKGVNLLLPGHYIKIKPDLSNEFKKYWDINTKNTLELDTEEKLETCISETKELLTDAVRLRLGADCEMGSMLSGGLDSSTITTIASQLTDYKLNCFTLKSENFIDEDFKYASVLADYLKPKVNHIPVNIVPSDFTIENLDRAIYFMEEILLDKVYIYINKNYKTAKSIGLKTVLNGQGADEISLGYYNYYQFLQKDQSEFTLDKFTKFWKEEFFLKEYIDEKELESIINKNLESSFVPFIGNDLLNSVVNFGIKTHLPNLLIQEDKLSLSEGVECRTVFTDYRLVEKMASIPSAIKIKDGKEKYIFKKIAENLIPEEIINRPKLGFPDLPDGYEKLIDSIIDSPDFKESKIISAIFDKKIFEDIKKLPINKRWKLASLFRFEKVFFS